MTSRADWMPEIYRQAPGKPLGTFVVPTFQDVVKAVAKDRDVPAKELLGRRRTKRVTAARHELWRRLHALGWSGSEIGAACRVHPTTVFDGVRKASLFFAQEITGEARQECAATPFSAGAPQEKP